MTFFALPEFLIESRDTVGRPTLADQLVVGVDRIDAVVPEQHQQVRDVSAIARVRVLRGRAAGIDGPGCWPLGIGWPARNDLVFGGFVAGHLADDVGHRHQQNSHRTAACFNTVPAASGSPLRAVARFRDQVRPETVAAQMKAAVADQAAP